jgi:hypothetical protein
MQSTLAVALVDEGLLLLYFLRLDGLFNVLPHAVAGNDGFL